MVINFRARGINRGTRKLTRILALIKQKESKKKGEGKHSLTSAQPNETLDLTEFIYFLSYLYQRFQI